MKININLLIVLIFLTMFGGCSLYLMNRVMPDKGVTSNEFKERINKVEVKVDSISQKVDYMQNDIDSLKHITKTIQVNTDTLKKGNEVIYSEVQKTNEGFFSKLKKFFE